MTSAIPANEGRVWLDGILSKIRNRESAMVAIESDRKQEKLILASTMFPKMFSETNALLLAGSIRTFAGSLCQSPIWYFIPDYGERLSATVKDRLLALNVTLIPFKVSYEILKFPFASEVLAAALAESMSCGQADLLAWLAANTIVLQEPKDFLLQDDKCLAFRPVHHTLVGSRYDEPLDPFWTLIYRYCNVPEHHVFPMMTHIDATRIRPYFNAGLLMARPETRLFQIWRDTFLKVHQEPSFQDFYQKDKRYMVFIHQAVLSGVILSTLTPDKIQELPSKYNYPLHLHSQDVTDQRPSSLEELVTFRHEGFYRDPDWPKKMPAKEPLKQWIAKQLPALDR